MDLIIGKGIDREQKIKDIIVITAPTEKIYFTRAALLSSLNICLLYY